MRTSWFRKPRLRHRGLSLDESRVCRIVIGSHSVETSVIIGLETRPDTMKACVIFNPVARGDKARHFKIHLDEVARDAALKPTTCAGDARRLAAAAVREGFDTVVAAGG